MLDCLFTNRLSLSPKFCFSLSSLGMVSPGWDILGERDLEPSDPSRGRGLPRPLLWALGPHRPCPQEPGQRVATGAGPPPPSRRPTNPGAPRMAEREP